MPMRKVMTGCISRERNRMTAKKKPYSFTIGFNEKKPDHVRAAQILNELGKREKSDYIARCILAYEGEKDLSEHTTQDSELTQSVIRSMVAFRKSNT